MVIGISSSNMSTADQIANTVKAIEQDLSALKKQDAKKTTHDLVSELIDYILAQMTGDEEAAKEIGDKIAKTIQDYTSDVQKADNLSSEAKSIESDPSKQTSKELNSLQALLALLANDLKSGDMSNLPSSI